MERLGLIAGNRKFPLIFAEGARKKGYAVVAIAIKKDTSPKLKGLVDKIYWLGLSDFSSMFEIFKKEGVKNVVMAGQISPIRLFSKEISKDPLLKEIMASVKNKKADTIFRAIADKLRERGFDLIDSTMFMEEYLPKKGLLTGENPSPEVWGDINFGVELAKEMGRLDVGQTVAVKDKAIAAVEALEGTDNLIRRAGKITRGFTLVKVSKPNQDNRFDIPVVGLNTVKNLVRSGARCLAIEAGKTLFIDQKEALGLARRKGLIVVAV
ncbi:MAG: UDP-2,3-diacylglucosamine diphosphatase LpxI [Candidatus Omnitrophica bacterium]|nr:UDP-2,3-diacylglucosamine diphosphatase LpxI [Candidatus Omnitrophota bacterium]